MRSAKWLAAPAYLVAMLVFVLPLLDTFASLAPLRLTDVGWRYGAAGLFSRSLLLPFVGLLVAFATAVLLEHRWMQRVVAVLALLASLLLMGGIVLFVLDALQLRAQVRLDGRRNFDLLSILAVFKHLLYLVTSVILGVSAWKAGSGIVAVRDAKRQGPIFTIGRADVPPVTRE